VERKAPSDVTQLLQGWREGDSKALDALLPLVYKELRRRVAHFPFLLSNRKQMRMHRPFDSAQGRLLRSWQGRAAMPPTHTGPFRMCKGSRHPPFANCAKDGAPPALVLPARSRTGANGYQNQVCLRYSR
jgi:hypothetical protein